MKGEQKCTSVQPRLSIVAHSILSSRLMFNPIKYNFFLWSIESVKSESQLVRLMIDYSFYRLLTQQFNTFLTRTRLIDIDSEKSFFHVLLGGFIPAHIS